MNPELEAAIRERIELGHTKEQISNELRNAGYDEDTIEQVYNAVHTNAVPTTTVPVAAANFPSAIDLFKSAWQFMTGRLDLVAAMAAPTAILALLEYVGMGITGVSANIIIVVGALASVVFMVLMQIVVVHAAVMTQIQPEAPKLADSFAWARSNVFSWLWLVIISALVVFGGWALLIVPGIIAAVYIAFAQSIFVAEEKRGFAALQRSRALLYGKFWSVAGRLLLFAILIVLLYIPFIVVAALLGAGVDGVENPSPLVGVVEALMSGVVAVISAHFITGMYVSVRNNVTSVQSTKWYKIYAWLGVVSIALYALLMVAAVGFMTMGGVDMMEGQFDVEQIQQQMSPEEQAEFEAFMQEFEAELNIN